ncbi:MAG: PIN domain-containing protein [Nanoarchaeota archaeon]
MRIIIDANIIISSFIKQGKSAELLINPALELYAPEFIMEEIIKYKDEILSKTHRTLESFSLILSEMLSLLKIVKKEDIEKYMAEASTISPDEKDAPYFSLALKLNCPILSNDKKLKEQEKVKVYSVDEILKLLEEKK